MPSGLSLHGNWISAAWERFLLAEIARGPLVGRPTPDRHLTPSHAARFGERTIYGGRHERLPAWASVLACMKPRVDFTHITVNVYQPGDGIGWHTDHPSCGDEIHVLSLGGPAYMLFRRNAEPPADIFDEEPPGSVGHVFLPGGCLLSLTGSARWRYDHMITPVSSYRVSIVMRSPPIAKLANGQ